MPYPKFSCHKDSAQCRRDLTVNFGNILLEVKGREEFGSDVGSGHLKCPPLLAPVLSAVDVGDRRGSTQNVYLRPGSLVTPGGHNVLSGVLRRESETLSTFRRPWARAWSDAMSCPRPSFTKGDGSHQSTPRVRDKTHVWKRADSGLTCASRILNTGVHRTVRRTQAVYGEFDVDELAWGLEPMPRRVQRPNEHLEALLGMPGEFVQDALPRRRRRESPSAQVWCPDVVPNAARLLAQTQKAAALEPRQPDAVESSRSSVRCLPIPMRGSTVHRSQRALRAMDGVLGVVARVMSRPRHDARPRSSRGATSKTKKRAARQLRGVGIFCWGGFNGNMKDDGSVGTLYTEVSNHASAGLLPRLAIGVSSHLLPK
ncbi:hypothetical protein B0H13DRAFT_1864417 [Mycena leptocephala]|nr:hypothetical protein B0H13DRAFT_1864417 [Mycena leptocephala]